MKAVEFNDGIWLLWRSQFHLNVVATHSQFIIVHVHIDRMTSWYLSIVYGNLDYGLRHCFGLV